MAKAHSKFSITKQRARYVISDLLSGYISFFVFNILRFYILKEEERGFSDLWHFLFSTKLIIEQIIVPFGLLTIYWFSGYYNRPFGKSRLQEMITTFFSSLINTIIIYLILLINDQTGIRRVNYELILCLFASLFLITFFFRLFITVYAYKHFRKHSWEFNTLIIGNSKVARNVAESLIKGNYRTGYNIIGFVEIPGENSIRDNYKVFHISQVENVCAEYKVDQLVIAPEIYNDKSILHILFKLFSLGIPIKISPDILSFVTSGIKLKDIFAEPFVDLTSPSISESSKNIKRFIDVFASALILLILSPLFLWIAISVKKSSKGPVFYAQERIGWKQKPFKIYKFRTMFVDAEKDGPQLSADNDSRITKTGKFLRKYRLDEIPQFWNVLKGEMSIVGPRPEREFFIRQIVEKAPYYTLVYQVRPGITSWGMVKYGYASSVDEMVERTRYDLIYLANMSLFVDAKILIYTIKTVITGKGI